MSFSKTLLACAIFLVPFACKKSEPDPTPTDPTPFTVSFQNEFSELQAHYAAWLSDADGKVLAFRWLKGGDSTQLEIADYPSTNPPLDLNLAKYTSVVGSGLTDTSLIIKTFTGVKNGESVRLRENEYRTTTTLNIAFTNITSLDTIIVPDGLPFARPGWWNNFQGIYQVQHTGDIWLRFQINGDDHWRYMYFKNVDNQPISATIDPSVLPVLAHSTPVQLLFVANWKYRVDGVKNLAENQFIPLGDLNRPPGGALPVFDVLEVFEPAPFDPLAPPSLPYQSYRFNVKGTDTEGLSYIYDQFLGKLPSTLPQANFDIQPIALGDNRLAGARCIGDFDALVLSRQNTSQPSINWEVYLPPSPQLTYRLPDVPGELSAIFPTLKTYNFGGKARGRAESYTSLGSYRDVLDGIFKNENPVWQATKGFLAVEKPL